VGVYSSFLNTSTTTSTSTTSSITCRPTEVDRQGVLVALLLALFVVAAVGGNALVILSVACERRLRTPTNLFVVNLAAADLLLGAAVLPFSAAMEVLGGCWPFGRVWCDVWAAADVLCCTASILSLCVIAVDRYVGVAHCLQYPRLVTEGRAAAALAAVWLCAAAVSAGPLLGWKEAPPRDPRVCRITEEPLYALLSSLCSFYAPLTVILLMYARVYVVARRTTRSLEAGVKRERSRSRSKRSRMSKEEQEEEEEVVLRIHCSSSSSAIKQQQEQHLPFRSSLSLRLLRFSREKKAAKTLAIVVGLFILCWLPFFFLLPLGELTSTETHLELT